MRYAYIIDVEIVDCDSRVSPWEGSRAGHVCCFIHIPTAIPGNYLWWKMWHLNFTSSKYNASKYNQKWWKVHLSGSCMTYRNIEIYIPIIYLLYMSHISPDNRCKKEVPSRELTYTSNGKGNPCSQLPLGEICMDISSRQGSSSWEV